MGAGASAAAVPANTSPVNVESEMEAVRLSLPNSLTEQVDALIEENSSSAPIPAPLEEPPTENKDLLLMKKLFEYAGVSEATIARALIILETRSIYTPLEWENALLHQRELLWDDIGISRRQAEDITRLGRELTLEDTPTNLGNPTTPSASSATRYFTGSENDEDDSSDGYSSGEAGLSYAHADIDLTHTRALANALGLLHEIEDSGEGGTAHGSAASNELESQRQEQRMREYETAQQAMLLSHQHAILEACRPSAINTQNASLGQSSQREAETRMEMMEMLQLALESTMPELSLQNPSHMSQRETRDISSDPFHSRRTDGLTDASIRSINEALSASAATTRNVDSGHIPEPGATVRRGQAVEMWNLDMSSPFVEYSPDAKAVLNRDNDTAAGPYGVPLLALTTSYTRGDKVSISIEVEYMPKMSSTPTAVSASSALTLPTHQRPLSNSNGNGSGRGQSSSGSFELENTSHGNFFSFGLALLDAMPAMGTHCFGKDPFSWGVYDDRRSSAFTQSSTIGSNGTPVSVCSNIYEGDVLSLVLDLDPNSLTALPAPAVSPGARTNSTTSRIALAGGNSKRDGKGCAHFLLNGDLLYSFQHLDCDKRYILGATLCHESCIRLVTPSLFQDSSRGAAAIVPAAPSAQMPQSTAAPPDNDLQGSSVLQILNQAHLERLQPTNELGGEMLPFQTEQMMNMLDSVNEALNNASNIIDAAPSPITRSPGRDSSYGTANEFSDGTFSRIWKTGNSTQHGPQQPSSPVNARNRNPQLGRPMQPPGPSPAAVRLGARFLESSLANHANQAQHASQSLSSREAMARANSVNSADAPIPAGATPPDYSLLTMTNNGGFSPSTAHWRDRQEQRHRHQIALREQLQAQQDRERDRQRAIRERERDMKYKQDDAVPNLKESVESTKGEGSPKTSSKDTGSEGESSMCCICWEFPKTVVLLPCRHMCVCEACGLDERTVPSCPMCRETVMQRFKVFT